MRPERQETMRQRSHGRSVFDIPARQQKGETSQFWLLLQDLRIIVYHPLRHAFFTTTSAPLVFEFNFFLNEV